MLKQLLRDKKKGEDLFAVTRKAREIRGTMTDENSSSKAETKVLPSYIVMGFNSDNDEQ